MMISRADVVKVAGAMLSVLLQLVLAPNMVLFGSFPCIPLVYVLAYAVANPYEVGPVLPFALGLVCDLFGTGPMGAYALLFMLSTMIVSRVFRVMNNDSMFMPLSTVFVSLLVVETIYGFVLIGAGLPASALGAFVMRALPCALYDFAIALLVYPVMARLMTDSVVISKNDMPYIKLR